MIKIRLAAAAGTAAAIIMLGMSAASASVTANGTTTIAGIQATSIGCAATKCVVVGTDDSSSTAKTALVNPATGATQLGQGALKNRVWPGGPDLVACSSKTTCLGFLYWDSALASISTSTGAQKVTAKLGNSYTMLGIGCTTSSTCYAVGGYEPPTPYGAPQQAVLFKLSGAGKILSKSVDKAYANYSGISCESSTTCLTIRTRPKGPSFQAVPLVNGKFGKPYTLPAGFLPLVISCYSTKLCYISGTNGFDGTLEELVPLNPKTGAPGKLIKLSGLAGGQPGAGFACYSSTQCVAASFTRVGTGTGADIEAAYIVITKGQAGKPVVASTKAGSHFTAVSCASSTECYAAGTYPGPLGGNGPQVSIVGKV